MGVAGWIIASVGAWAAIHNNGGQAGFSKSGNRVIRLSGGASWMSPAARRFWGIVLVLFGASLIASSMVLSLTT